MSPGGRAAGNFGGNVAWEILQKCHFPVESISAGMSPAKHLSGEYIPANQIYRPILASETFTASLDRVLSMQV